MKNPQYYLDYYHLILHKKDLLHPMMLPVGWQQRLPIARSLAMNPKVMIFDGPTSVLDPERINGVAGVMEELAFDREAMVAASHKKGVRTRGVRPGDLVGGEPVRREGETEMLPSNPRQARTKVFPGKVLHMHAQ
jgi:ABC-type polar amino acid transport system ATPase subunit